MVPRLVEGLLSASESDLVAGHVAGCAPCRRELDASRRLAEVLRRHMAGPEPPAGFPVAVRRRLRRG